MKFLNVCWDRDKFNIAFEFIIFVQMIDGDA